MSRSAPPAAPARAAAPQHPASPVAPARPELPEGALLSVQGLKVAFHQNGRTSLAVDDVSFHIDKGETLALVGESGSGKSVSALSILKLLPYPTASHPGGAVYYRGENLIDDDEADLRKVRGNKISMIFQEPMSSLNPLHTIERQVGEVLKIHRGVSDKEANRRTLELLHQVGIRDPEKRLGAYPHQLSGGQRQRVMIAMALANEPDLLIADEPTTALDVTVQAQILELLKVQQQKRQMAMLFITHDLGIVRKIADRVCVMYRGKIVETGPTEEIFANPQHHYTRHLLAAEPKGSPPPANLNAPVVMEAKDLKVWFPVKTGFLRRTTDHIKAVDGVDITLRAGQTVGIVGESGSGKTTLGLALSRMISSKGAIRFDGEPIDTRSFAAMRPLRRKIQIVFQDPFGSLSPRMTIADIIAEGLAVHEPKLRASERDDRVVAALNEVGLDPATRFRYPHEFSGGQRQRVAIARAMVLNPRFVMLDEPTSALDMSVQAQVVDLLRDLQKKHDLAYLFISHDLKVVRALANEVIVMRNGVVMERGPAVEIFERPQTDYTKALMAAAFDIATAPTDIAQQ
ncbi:ABC transporter ATP-binding protein [Aureimonas glaciei]|uniref:ABC transporter ATP-binding protein n=1 Tax=Aureimonas glaciei TaxID=1776957 RepID=A0A916XT31_9HYPH|nr:ABC transporter ATP-binding protein [Aureimonas glaciei]